MKLSEIAERLEGCLEGDGDIEIHSVAGLKEAVKGEISFLANPRYTAHVVETAASAVIVSNDWKQTVKCALIRTEDPDRSFTKAARFFYKPIPVPEMLIHPSASIAESACLGNEVAIGAHAVIEEGSVIGAHTVIHANCVIGYKTEIGEDCLLYPLVSIREFSKIGNRVIVHNGAVIGSDGFGYTVEKDGSRTKIPQIGSVLIEDDVEIGANVTIDRARFGTTKIGRGTKIDNLVQIAHNVVIGEHTVICGQAGISGSTTVGSNVILAGQSGLSGHLAVGDRAIIGAQAGVMKDVPKKDFVMGSPAMNHLQAKKAVIGMADLPRLKKRVKQLENELNTMKSR